MSKRTIKILKTIWVAAGIGFMFWLYWQMRAHDVPEEMYQSSTWTDAKITDDLISFTPKKTYKQTLIFFPGALVDPEAYIPLCRTLADSGIRTYILKVPFRMASRNVDMPVKLNLFSDKTQQYIVAGHSQGGKAAAEFVHKYPKEAQALVLLGTTHPRDFSLANSAIEVLQICGTNDGVASLEQAQANRINLPQNGQFEEIIGANHAQFGYYGTQLGDDKADLSREDQHTIVNHAILSFLQSLPQR